MVTVPRARWLLYMLVGIACAVTVSGAATGNEPRTAHKSSIVTPRQSGRYYYLADANVTSDEALTACAPGFHMASLWEIIDPSNLTYAYNHPDAHTKDDSGQGPPSFWYGRVRTGTVSSGLNTAGIGNCNNWTSTSSADYGTFVRLGRSWETPPGEIGGIWDAATFACSFTGPVWCVGDFYIISLPLVME